MNTPEHKIEVYTNAPAFGDVTAAREDIIFVDYSILSTFATCEEKGRLAYVEHFRPKDESPPLVFGSAFHAGVAALYTATTAGLSLDDAIEESKRAFIDAARSSGALALPLSGDSLERRSVERGCNLLAAYARKWRTQDVLWEDITFNDPKTGEVKPYIEIGFALYFMTWRHRPVMLAGKIDRVRRYRVDSRRYSWETKTTTSGVNSYVQQVRPNHQLTGYKWACRELFQEDIAGSIFDVIFVSDRKIDGKFPDGVNPEKDFARVETRRSSRDIEEFLFDLRRKTTQFLSFQEAEGRWHRNAPTACYMYGGCHFRKICESNLNEQIIRNNYKVQKWEPWLGLERNPK